jgi:DUF4097 and DUF4098 domain-containing protein YvlB
MKSRRLAYSVGAVMVAFCLAHPALATASAEGTFQKVLQVSGPVNLDISTGSGSINIQTGGQGQVQITGHIKVTNWLSLTSDEEKVRRIQANPPVQQSGNDIRIGHIEDFDLRRNVSVSYDVVVPANTQVRSQTGSGSQTVRGVQGAVEATTGSGSVSVSDTVSTVRAETGSGSVDINNVKGNVRTRAGSGSIRATGVAGGFEGNTGSGHITLEQTAPGAVRAETGSGGLDLSGVHGSLEARAGSGSIHVDGDPSGAWTVHSGSGSVHMRVPSNVSFNLDAQTSSGSISIDHPVTVEGSLGKKHIQGRVRGGGVPVNVETGSGNIEIE